MSVPESNIAIPDTPLFLLTIDTEEEWDWSGEFPKPPFSTENIEQVPDFQVFCKRHDIMPTYFIDYAVAENKKHAGMLKEFFDKAECDIGAHLHPWATPPIDEDICDENSHAVNLPITLFERKIVALTEKLNSVFGQHPYSYRAGRWGVNSQQLSVMSKHGYRVDSSVRPFYTDSSFDYTNAPTKPYWPSEEDALTPGDGSIGILEIPATSGYTRTNFEQLHKIQSKLSTPPINRLRLVGILWRLGMLRPVTVTPEGNNYKDVCACIDASIKRGDRVINMFFHSSDLLPGCTQYVRTAADKIQMMDTISRCVDHIRSKHNARMTCMRDIRKQLTGIA